METLKIAMFSWESMHSVRTGGLAQATTELSEALAKKDHEVHFFTRFNGKQPEREKIDGVEYHRCPFDQGMNIMQYAENMCNSMVDTFNTVEKEVGRFDVIHGHDWHVVNALNRLKSEKGYPHVLTFHSTEYGRNGGAHGDWWEFREISGREWYGGYVSNKIITVSHTMKGELMHLYGIPDWKINVVPNGIKAEKYRRKLDPGRVKEKFGIHPLSPTVLFIGRLVMQKGPDLFVEAIPRIINHRWDAKFIIAGDGGMRGHLEHRTWQLGVKDSVRFLGYVSDETYAELLNACDIVCITSRNEPFGIVLLEAWAAERAVVATEVGGLGENITNFVNGIKVYLTPESIAWGINYIINDALGVRTLGKNGRATAEKFFNWDVIASKTLEVYKSGNLSHPR